jgi:dGTPase
MATRTGDPVALSSFKQRMEAVERAGLSPVATRSYPALRAIPEQDSPVRTPFQRDRDRIVHSKAFRRLKHKTQVFISPEGDHYRTRLTHTLETTGIARTVARALGLNEDLTEAIGLGHDLGHPPFGHIGEEVLDQCLQERFDLRFRHNHHSLRIVEVLERDGAGLNLTAQVRDGILRHTWSEPEPSTLEGRIVRLVDRIAYINHDIDDAIRAGVLRPEQLPRAELELLGDTGSRRIDTLIGDVIEQFEVTGEITQGPEVGDAMMNLRTFMFENVYLAASAKSEHPRIERMLRVLFDHYVQTPPPPMTPGASEAERIVDWLAGMTDRYAIRIFSDLAVPQGF